MICEPSLQRASNTETYVLIRSWVASELMLLFKNDTTNIYIWQLALSSISKILVGLVNEYVIMFF